MESNDHACVYNEGTKVKDRHGIERCVHKVLWHGEIHYVNCGMALDQAFDFGIDKEPSK